MEFQILNEADFRRELKNEPRTGYLFFGEEDYLKAFAVKQARETICPDETLAFFNDMRLDALTSSPEALLDAMTPLPMMADRKLITMTGLNFTSMKAEDVDALCEVLSALQEYDYNTLIVSVAADCINEGRLPKKPSAILLRLSEYLTPVQFVTPTNAKLAAWIAKHFSHNGVTVDPQLCYSMIDFCGHSMHVLANEVDKLSFYALSQGQSTVSEADMRRVCIPADEYDAFAFANAVMNGQQQVALNILLDYKLRRVEPVIALGEISRVICDMAAIRAMTAEGLSIAEIGSAMKYHEYRIGLFQKSLRNIPEKRLHRALQLCTDADTTLKSSPMAGYSVLERLICGI